MSFIYLLACMNTHTHDQTYISAKGEVAVDPNDKRRVVITELKVNASEMSTMSQLEHTTRRSCD
jgi:hypothetical protein